MGQIPEGAIGSVNFDQMVGLSAHLYYNNHLNRFQLGSVEFEVIEDEDDGYRSSMQEVAVIRTDAPTSIAARLATVRIEAQNTQDYTGDFDGYKLVDEQDGHEWLMFGTNHADDYYPCFVYSWTPKNKTDPHFFLP